MNKICTDLLYEEERDFKNRYKIYGNPQNYKKYPNVMSNFYNK